MSDSSQDITFVQDMTADHSDQTGIYLCVNVLKIRHIHILFAYQLPPQSYI